MARKPKTPEQQEIQDLLNERKKQERALSKMTGKSRPSTIQKHANHLGVKLPKYNNLSSVERNIKQIEYLKRRNHQQIKKLEKQTSSPKSSRPKSIVYSGKRVHLPKSLTDEQIKHIQSVNKIQKGYHKAFSDNFGFTKEEMAIVKKGNVQFEVNGKQMKLVDEPTFISTYNHSNKEIIEGLLNLDPKTFKPVDDWIEQLSVKDRLKNAQGYESFLRDNPLSEVVQEIKEIESKLEQLTPKQLMMLNTSDISSLFEHVFIESDGDESSLLDYTEVKTKVSRVHRIVNSVLDSEGKYNLRNM